jgi:phage terminase large subunit
MKMYNSHHEDNPVLYDHVKKDWTPFGVSYIAKLDMLTGVRKKRYRYGIWAAAEGMIYTEWNPDVHMIDHFKVPADWLRIWLVDFGFTNPFVWQCWAVNPDGICYRTAELYRTQLLVEDACAVIKAWRIENDEPAPVKIICDWDAEDRATFERHMGMETIAASKSVSDGIQAVKSMLKIQENHKPRIMYMRDSSIEVDQNLVEAMKPFSSEQEFESYEWSSSKKEQPRKEDDHGMDLVRYLAQYLKDEVDSWSIGMGR